MTLPLRCASPPPSHQIYIVTAWKEARGGGGVTSVLITWTTSYLLGESEALSNKPDLHKTVSIKDNEEISCHRAKAILL